MDLQHPYLAMTVPISQLLAAAGAAGRMAEAGAQAPVGQEAPKRQPLLDLEAHPQGMSAAPIHVVHQPVSAHGIPEPARQEYAVPPPSARQVSSAGVLSGSSPGQSPGPSSGHAAAADSDGGATVDARRPDRSVATKEKNRKAQQRFRQRQKEKMQSMEAEIVRLRTALGEGGEGKAAGAAAAAASAPDPGGPRSASGQPSVDEMYDELEQALDSCEVGQDEGIPFLQWWLKLNWDERRQHHKAVRKRFAADRREDVRLWVRLALEGRAG